MMQQQIIINNRSECCVVIKMGKFLFCFIIYATNIRPINVWNFPSNVLKIKQSSFFYTADKRLGTM